MQGVFQVSLSSALQTHSALPGAELAEPQIDGPCAGPYFSKVCETEHRLHVTEKRP